MAVLRRAQGQSVGAHHRTHVAFANQRPDHMLLQAVASRIVARQTPDAHLITEERKRKNYAEFWNVIPVTEPYRCVLAEVRDKLYHTRSARLPPPLGLSAHWQKAACAHGIHAWLRLSSMCREVLHHALVHPNVNVREYLENDPEAYYSKDELLEPLTLIYNSLLTCGDKYIAHGRLLDCIRQVSSHCASAPTGTAHRPSSDSQHVRSFTQVTCFGMGLVTLDVRQESTRHSDAIDTVTQYLGLGSYKAWDEEQRLNFLIGELTGKRPLMPPGMQ